MPTHLLQRVLACSLAMLLSCSLSAQTDEILFSGIIQDGDSKANIEFATVKLLDALTEEVLAGTTTSSDGAFQLSAPEGDITVEVSFIGFETIQISEYEVLDATVELGIISLRPSDYSLEDVVIEGQQSSTEFQLDKRVFRVGQDLSSTGASALEVLNNVPSVNVSIEGAISLRGSAGVQILINGKPSVLASEEGNALGTITADMIEKVEVITNPSAKYDAEGTAGIINIVLKKEERQGVNGSATLNTGWPHNHSFGLSMNRRSNKFNLFTQLGAGYRELRQEQQNRNTNLLSNTSIVSEGLEFRNEQFYNFILGTDYYINDLNVITLSGNFAYEVEDQPSQTDFALVDALGDTVSRWTREEITQATNPKWQYELNYKREYEDHEDHALIFSAQGRFFGKDQASEFINSNLLGEGLEGLQETRTRFSEAENMLKLDYTHPFLEKYTVETGAQYVINDVSNDFAVADFIDNEWVNDPTQTNIFDWNQKVLGVYGTAAYEGARWGLMLGLRMENTDLNTLLRNTEESNDQNYSNFFPSAHSSFKFNEHVSVQAGYSRRIFRPRLWDLNPFFNIRNNFNIRVGNPDLLPEFTDSYEVAGIYTLNNFSMNMAVYHRITNEVVERVSFFENGVTTVMPMNLGINRSTGLEINGKYSLGRWFSVNGDFNFNAFAREGELEGQSFDFAASQYTGKLTTKFKLPKSWDLEATGHYLSSVRTVQGMQSANTFMDLGVRKKLKGGRAVINLSVRDVFISRFRETIIQQDDFTAYSWGRRGRFITLGFSYGFGKGEAMEFSGQKRF